MDDVTNFQRATYQMMRNPQYCTLAMYLLNMEIIADDKVGTAATDCVRKVWYSPKYFADMTVDECKAALVHEVYHPFLNFFPRFERWAKRYPDLPRKQLLQYFNIAQDYFINWIVKHEWDLPIQDSWYYNPEYNPTHYTTESIADKLVAERNDPPANNTPPMPSGQSDEAGSDQSPDDQSAPNDDATDQSPDDSDEDTGDDSSSVEDDDSTDGEPVDAAAGEGDDIVLPDEYNGSIDNVLSEEDINKMETANRTASANADRMAKPARGKGDGAGDPFTGAIDGQNYMVRHDWAAQLHHYANDNVRSGSHTYTRPNTRRRTSQGAMYPGPVGKRLGTIVFAIDSSGSTSGQMVNYFFREMESALKMAEFDKAVVIWCSEGIPLEGVFEYTKSDVGKLDKRIRRAGVGTEFMPVFERVKRDYPDAACLTYLTDGGVGDYDITECFEYWTKNLRNVPIVWALADMGWNCTAHFTERCNRIGFGVVAELPMHEVLQMSN